MGLYGRTPLALAGLLVSLLVRTNYAVILWMDEIVSWCKTGLQELNSLA